MDILTFTMLLLFTSAVVFEVNNNRSKRKPKKYSYEYYMMKHLTEKRSK